MNSQEERRLVVPKEPPKKLSQLALLKLLPLPPWRPTSTPRCPRLHIHHQWSLVVMLFMSKAKVLRARVLRATIHFRRIKVSYFPRPVVPYPSNVRHSSWASSHVCLYSKQGSNSCGIRRRICGNHPPSKRVM